MMAILLASVKTSTLFQVVNGTKKTDQPGKNALYIGFLRAGPTVVVDAPQLSVSFWRKAAVIVNPELYVAVIMMNTHYTCAKTTFVKRKHYNINCRLQITRPVVSPKFSGNKQIIKS